jgi:hypothetical protein
VSAAMPRESDSAGRQRRTMRYLQLCHKTRTLITLDDKKNLVQAITVGDGWLLVHNAEREDWIDLARLSSQGHVPADEMRLRLSDQSSLIIETGAETFWLCLSGACITLTTGEMTSFRRGWRNLQLRAGWVSEAPVSEVPYLAPRNPAEQESGDIIFLGPVYFSDSLRLGDIHRSDRTPCGLSGEGSLPLIVAGFVASATLGASHVSRSRDFEARCGTLSVAASDAAAIAAVVMSLALVEAYSDRLGLRGVPSSAG